MSSSINLDRRNALKMGLVAAGIGLTGPAVVAQEMVCKGLTPVQPEGPFYPKLDQADKDADLIYLQGSNQVAQGEVIFVEGIVTNELCLPIEGALVEIWQACASGKYNHESDPNDAPLDPHFQYWGKAITDKDGIYRFRTVIPGAYQADADWRRPPHIHYKVQKLGYRELITQLYFEGDSLNEKDLILQSLPKSEQKKVVVPLKPTAAGLRLAQFNISLKKVRGPQ